MKLMDLYKELIVEGKKKNITVKGSISDIASIVTKAKKKGQLQNISNAKAESEIRKAISLLTPTSDDPGKKIKCKKSCSSTRSGGTCVLGGCFTLKGFPPKKFSWTWEI